LSEVIIIGANVRRRGSDIAKVLRMNFSESSRDWRFTPKIRIANTGRTVNAANMGAGLSIVNGRRPTTRGRLMSHTILVGISSMPTNLTLAFGVKPYARNVSEAATKETTPEAAKSVSPRIDSSKILLLEEDFSEPVTAMTAK
jgi:hypothetical protein